jgi:hypothetical protein
MMKKNRINRYVFCVSNRFSTLYLALPLAYGMIRFDEDGPARPRSIQFLSCRPAKVVTQVLVYAGALFSLLTYSR